jgi:hypothetical protein
MGHFGIKLAFLPLKTMIFRNFSFQKITQFKLGNNGVYAPPSYTGGFLSRDTWVSST